LTWELRLLRVKVELAADELELEVDALVLEVEEEADSESPYPMVHEPDARMRTGLPPLVDTDVGTPDRDSMVDCAGRVTVALNGDVKLTVQAPPVLLVKASVS
jgi:hypothetical protein